MVARVATNAESPPHATRTPLARPHAPPRASPAATLNGTLVPPFMSKATMMPTRLASAPTERSKSPVTITIVTPAETIARVATCSMMLRRFPHVGKMAGRRAVKAANRRRNPRIVPHFFSTREALTALRSVPFILRSSHN